MRLLTILFLVLPWAVVGQRFISDSSHVHFYSDAPIEVIEAVNTQGSSILDISSKEIVFSIPITEFQFEKSLMQEHFNENYLESDKYPRSTFKGTLKGWDTQRTSSNATAVGELTIHGRVQTVELDGTIEKKGTQFLVDAKFPIKLTDYKIKIPKAVFYNIAEVVEVTIHFEYQPYEED